MGSASKPPRVWGKSKIIIKMRISQKEVQAELFSEIVNGRSIKKTVILKNMLCG